MALAYPSQQLILDHRLLRMHSRAYAIASALQLVPFPDPRFVIRVNFQAHSMVTSMEKSQSQTKVQEMDSWMAVHNRTQRHPLLPRCCLRFPHLHFLRLRRPCPLHSPKDHRFLRPAHRVFVWLHWGCCLPVIPTLLFPVRRCPQSRVIWLSLQWDRAQHQRRLWLLHVSADAAEPLPSPLPLSQGYLEAPVRSRGR